MTDEVERHAGASFDRLSAAIRELQAQVTEDVLNLRARLLAVEQELEEMRGQAKGHPGENDEPPAAKAGARGATKRAPTKDAKRTKGTKGTKSTQDKAPKSSRSKS
jgi:hypothetical protein